jgi:hypothetical protein
MLIAWCIGGACALAALVLCFTHLGSFGHTEQTNRRKYFTGVVLMAPVRKGLARRLRAAAYARALGAHGALAPRAAAAAPRRRAARGAMRPRGAAWAPARPRRLARRNRPNRPTCAPLARRPARPSAHRPAHRRQVFAITNYLSMFFPRAAALFELIQHVYEAQALFSFGMLIFDLASDGETDYLLAREIFLAKLAMVAPRKLDASPPLCFLSPFVPAVQVDGHRLDKIMDGLKVFGYVVPCCAVVRLWITVEAKNAFVRCRAAAQAFCARVAHALPLPRRARRAGHLGLADRAAAD